MIRLEQIITLERTVLFQREESSPPRWSAHRSVLPPSVQGLFHKNHLGMGPADSVFPACQLPSGTEQPLDPEVVLVKKENLEEACETAPNATGSMYERY